MKTAIVSIAIGAASSARFRAHCEGGWSRYADRHGFQLIVIETPGVLVLAPKHHCQLLEHVYYSYEDHGGESMNYEMRPLSYEIQRQSLLHVLDSRFNALLIFLIMQRQMQLRRALVQANAPLSSGRSSIKSISCISLDSRTA